MMVVLLVGCDSEPNYIPASEREVSGGNKNEQNKDDTSPDDNEGNEENKEGSGNDNNGPAEGDQYRINGHGYVDMGLSVRWATANLDASNPAKDGKPQSPGSLFKWGAIAPVSSSGVATSFPDTGDMVDIAGSGNDAAAALWGAPWRIPTSDEINELLSACEITREYGGCRLTADNGASIFLPAAGYCDLLTGSSVYDLLDPGVTGRYWSSTATISMNITLSDMNETPAFDISVFPVPRYCGCSIRPVCPR